MSDAREVNEGVSQAEVQPWHRLGGVEHICELRKNAQVLYSIFVTILRVIYSSKDGRTFGCPDVLWSKDSQKTELWIDTELRWEDQRPDFTPAIYVSLSELQYEFPPTLDMQARTFLSHDAERHYERTVSGAVTFLHVADTAGTACSLADNTENYLSMLQDQLAEEYCFDHLVVSGRAPRQKKETAQSEGKEKYISTVTVKFDFTDAWVVKMETPILKVISMLEESHQTININGDDIDIRTGPHFFEKGDVCSEIVIPNLNVNCDTVGKG